MLPEQSMQKTASVRSRSVLGAAVSGTGVPPLPGDKAVFGVSGVSGVSAMTDPQLNRRSIAAVLTERTTVFIAGDFLPTTRDS
jgi:hypothetical protein